MTLESLQMPRYIVEELTARGVSQHETSDLDSVIKQSDVLYVTRVQKVRRPTSDVRLDWTGRSFLIRIVYAF